MSDDLAESGEPTETTAHDHSTADRDESRPADVKTAPDGTPIERTAPPAQWEAVGRHALADVLRHHRDAVEREIEQVASAIEYGAPVDPDHVRNLRDAIEALEVTTEARLAALVDDLDPWERTAGRVPYGRLYDALDVDEADVAEVKRKRAQTAGTE